VLLAGLSSSMSILWCDSRSEWLFECNGVCARNRISGDSTPTLTISFGY
jgi:hypothetical protein